jgi:PKD repeat protein
MRKLLLATIVMLCYFGAHAQSYKWLKGGGSIEAMSTSEDYERVKYMCTDVNGNVYIAAVTGASHILADTFYVDLAHNDYSPEQHILLASYRCDGTMRWAKLIESYNFAHSGGIGYANGSIYLAGCMVGGNKYVGYDTAMTTENMSSFTLRVDTSGQFKWIKFIGMDVLSTQYTATSAGSLAIDKDGYIHNFNIIRAGCQLTSSLTIPQVGTYDLKYDSAGNLISVNALPALDSIWQITRAIFSPTSNKYYATLQPLEAYYYSFYSNPNYAVAAFTSAGSMIWRDTTGSNGYVLGFDYKGGDAMYVAGSVSSYSGSLFLGGMGVTDTLFPMYRSSFIFKLDTNDVATWAYNLQGSGSLNELFDVTILPNSKVAATGYFYGKLKHGVDSIVCPTATEHDNPSLVIIDSSGHTVKLDQLHGPGMDDIGYAITCDQTGNIFMGGSLSSTIAATGLSPYVTNGGNTDFYLVKYGFTCGCTTIPVSGFTSSGVSTVNFTYTGTMGYDSVRWYFGDGGTSTLANPTHAYASSGTYHACVTVYTGCGSDTHCSDIVAVVCSSAPVAAFTSSGASTVNFTYTGTPVYDSVRWQFGDGGTSTLGTPAHTYTSSGTYTVCVTVFTSCGNNTHCGTVTVCALPVPAFTSTGLHTVHFTYTGTSSYDSLRWRFGDGGTSTLAAPAHTFAASGTYHVCVKVYNSCGFDSTCTDKVINLTGVNAIGNEEINVYPNPVRDGIVIEHAAYGSNVRVLDMTGRTVYSGIITDNMQEIDVSSLASGPYALQITDTEGNRTTKTIIKE